MPESFDIVVLGGGTAGLVTASGCARLGRKVALIEREALGGDCLWTGCVPTKALVASAKLAHQMRHADAFGLEPVAPRITPQAVMDSMREQRRRISRHDDPERFRRLGVDVIEGKARLASSIVWFDALVTNVDRTAKNTNLLVWHRELYMIDHGATLIFHHSWDDHLERARAPYKQFREHVLLRWATELREADAELAPRLTGEVIERVLALIPDDWLGDEPRFASIEEHRNGYRDYLLARLQSRARWLEAANAQARV